MVRGRNPFWNYAEELNSKPERFRCTFCKLEFSGAIPRIKSHLSGITGRGIVACEKVSDQVRQLAKLEIENPGNVRLLADSELENPSKRARTTDTSTDAEDRERSEGFTPETLEKNNSMVDEKLAKFLLSYNIGFDVVEAPSFADFVRYVAEFGVEYKLPSSSVLHRKFLPQVQSEVEKYISNVRDSWKKTGCSIMLDSCHNFINIMAYSLEGAIFMRSVEVSKRQSVDIIHDILPSIIEEIGIDHVVQFITNDAAIFHYVESMLPSKYPKMFVVRCVAHEIDYLLEETSSEFQWIKEVIQDAKLIVSFIYTHDNVSSLMRQYTNNKELKYPCKSTFASNYQMLKSLFDNRNELEQLVASDSWCLLNFEKKEAIADIIKGNEFWDKIRQVLNFMEQFVRVLRLVEDDRCTSGYLYEEMKTAKQATRSFSIDSEKVIQMVEMRSERIIHPIHAAAAFLNPAIMSRVNFEEDDEMKQGIEFMLNTLVGTEEKNSFMKEVQLYRRKVSKLFNSAGHVMLDTNHPSIWWDYCGTHLPVLRKYAIRVLSQPCKCSFGLQYCARKVSQVMKVNGITPSSWDSLIYTKINAMIMEKFRILEEKLPLPITLADCNENTDYVQYCGDGLAELIDEASGNRGVGETDPLSKNDSTAKQSKIEQFVNENNNSKAGSEASSSEHNKQAEQSCKPPEPPKQDYIHVRARRGQPTDSHSLAERARREKISERMKFLQDLVPGCNKIIGKALVLDEIINFIQSLQRQVEFLSMKLGTVNSRMSMNPMIEGFHPKDPFDAIGMMFGSQATREYAQGSQPEWLHMQVGGSFQRAA